MTTEITREAHRQVRERTELDALLDEVRIGHVGIVRSDGTPLVVPTIVARDTDALLMHGSTGSPWIRAAAAGNPVCVTVTALDAIIVARSAFESSMRYCSAVLFGQCLVVNETEAKTRALDVLTDSVLPGRSGEVRRPTRRELAATLVLALPIEQWSLKISDGYPADGPDDVAGPAWAGVVPLTTRPGPAVNAPDLQHGIDLPESVRRLSQ